MRSCKIILLSALFTLGSQAVAQSVYPGQHKGKMQIEVKSPSKMESFDLSAVRLLPSRVRDNLERDSAWMVNISVNRLLHSFRNNSGVYAGLEGGYESVKKYGGWESLDCDLRGHTTGHLMSAYGLMFAATGQDIFKLKGDSIVAGLKEVQDVLGSGFLSAYPEELINRNLRGQGVWAPWYTLHKLFAGLMDQYLYAGNPTALEIATKMGDWAYEKLSNQSEETRKLMLRNEFGGMNEAFYNLYAITGNPKYEQLAKFFYHNDVLDPLAAGDANFGTKHTNTFIPKILGEVRNYEMTGDKSGIEIARSFWNEVVNRHSFATGSVSQKEHFFDPAKMSQYINGYTGETCCTYNMLKLSHHLMCAEGEGSIGDYYERALFNHILGQQDTETGMVCYFMPLLSGAYKVYSTPENSFWCCVGSGFENHAKYAEAIYYHDDNSLYINQFIPSRLNWEQKNLTLRQTTQFPEKDITEFEFESTPAGLETIKLRLPYWSGHPEVWVNGKKHKASIGSDCISLKGKWEKGDKIKVKYPMSLHVSVTPDDSERGALMYGPVVLAGNLGTQNMSHPAPFSNPNVRNDYYTYDYNIPENLNTSLKIDLKNPSASIQRNGEGLHFVSAEGQVIYPLYDMHHCRYVVYWVLK